MLVSVDPEKSRLVSEYTLLTTEIVLNETAMEESREYAVQIINSDKTEVTEHLNQIKELSVYVNKEKKRRDAARASLIVHEWGGKRSELQCLVRTPALKLNTVASHEKLCALYDKLMAKDEKIVGLRSKLKNQLTTKNSDQDRCKKLQEISSRLESELRGRDMLDKEREKLSTELMCVDKGVRSIVGDLLQ
ncbi:hypothetical protein PC128_g439 [Phytophthora cactorum]|nr:hypothetical protein PC120_g137 [Phytophthora cactorum]KAG3101979.1 hypothetical protein PC121_g1326 [Phytophthora cactorum]KAG3206811.1 hypothetical protein PC128_g439 [Phytophthora cactorum]